MARRATADYNFAVEFPELAREWHPDCEKLPTQVTPKSNFSALWRCAKGHSFRRRVNRRRPGDQCPYCSGNKASEDNNLAVTNPKLAREWHPTKNGDLTARDVTSGSSRKVWWRCGKDHEWPAVISNRARHNQAGCPKCNLLGGRVAKGNSLAEAHPELAQQWHPTKNNKQPHQVSKGSVYKASWQCKAGHEWERAVRIRAAGERCPHCYPKDKTAGLHKTHPHLLKQWDYEKNVGLDPRKLTAGSSRKAHWVCEAGHKWAAAICNRSLNGAGCPACRGRGGSGGNNLEEKAPHLAKEWSNKNDLPASKVTPSSSRVGLWECTNGHTYKSKVSDRFHRSTGCPLCLGRVAHQEHNLAAVNPGLAEEWHPAKNKALTPQQVTPHSNKKVWWRCQANHQWEASPASRSRGVGCPVCSGQIAGDRSLAMLRPDLAKEWSPKNPKGPESYTLFSHYKAWWICEAGHEWQTFILTRSQGCGCPTCATAGGFDPNDPAALYLLKRYDGVAKIGITGQGLKERRRMAQHRKNGYTLHNLWRLEEGHRARELELLVLNHWRNTHDAPPAAAQGEDGWTETVSVHNCSLESTENFVNSLLSQTNPA